MLADKTMIHDSCFRHHDDVDSEELKFGTICDLSRLRQGGGGYLKNVRQAVHDFENQTTTFYEIYFVSKVEYIQGISKR